VPFKVCFNIDVYNSGKNILNIPFEKLFLLLNLRANICKALKIFVGKLLAKLKDI
jgi:hypothetical protein